VVQHNGSTAKLVVIGSTAVDVISQARVTPGTDSSLGQHSTSPGTVRLHLGGVGRNVAEAAYRISISKFQAHPSATVLVSSVGDDSFGRLILEEMRRTGMRTDGITTAPQRSAVCSMVLDGSGNLIGGVADMDIVESIEPDGVRWYLHTHGDRKPIPEHRSSPRSPSMIRRLSQWTLTFHRMYSRP